MKTVYRASLALSVIVAAGCSPSKTNVATVNGEAITKDQLAAQLLSGPEAKAAMRTVILQTILNDGAKKANVKIDDAEVTRYLQARKDQMPPGRFDEATLASGATAERIRQDARTDVVMRALQMQGAKVSDESIKKEYDANPGGMYSKPEWVHLGNIVTKDAQDAKNAISALKDGADFATVAGKFTIPQAKAAGVGLQWVGVLNGAVVSEQRQPLTGLEPAVKSVILKTPAGKASAPMAIPRTPYYRVIYIATRAAGGKLPLDEVRGEIAYGIAAKNNQIKPTVLDDLLKDAKIEIKDKQFEGLDKVDALMSHGAGAGAGAPR